MRWWPFPSTTYKYQTTKPHGNSYSHYSPYSHYSFIYDMAEVVQSSPLCLTSPHHHFYHKYHYLFCFLRTRQPKEPMTEPMTAHQNSTPEQDNQSRTTRTVTTMTLPTGTSSRAMLSQRTLTSRQIIKQVLHRKLRFLNVPN